jgi:cytochrome c-type biogenesis protein CcmH/NrfG
MQKSVFESISFYVLVLVTFLIPLFFLPLSFISIQFGSSLLFSFGVILSLVLFIAGVFSSGSISLPNGSKYILGFTALVPIVYLLAGISNGFSRITFFGYTFDQSTVGFIFLSFVYMILLSLVCNTRQRVFYSYVAFLTSSIIFSLFLLARVILGVKFMSFGIFNDITSTTLGNWNSVGIFFGITALLSLISFNMLRVSKVLKTLLIISLALSLFFVVLVNFNPLWIVLAISTFLFVVFNFFNSRRNASSYSEVSSGEYTSMDNSEYSEGKTSFISRISLLPLLVFIISIVFVVWGPTFGQKISQKFSINSIDVRPSLAVTADIAKNTLENHPLFGSGPNNFVKQWLSYKPDDVTSTVFWNTDFAYGIGLLPTFAVTTGLFGILSWLLFFGMFLFVGVKSIFAKTDDSFVKFLTVSSFFVSILVWIMSIIYVPSTVIFILAFFFTGLFFASVYESGIVSLHTVYVTESPRKGFVYSLVMIALVVGSVSLGFGLYSNSKSLWYFQESSHALNTENNTVKAEELMNKAISAVPYDVYYRALAEIELVKLKAISSQDSTKTNKDATQKQISDTLSLAIKAALSARDADPANYQNWVALGRVYQSVVPLKVQGAYESSQFAYSEAVKRNPKNPGILLMLSQLEVDNGNLQNARNFALQAVNTKTNYIDAYFLLAQIEIATGNLQGAVDSVTALSILSPSDPTIFFQLGYLKLNGQDWKGAIQAFEKSLSLSPQYANAKYFLGIAYEAVGERAKAIAQFEDLSRTNPDNQQVVQILAQLRSGKSIFATAETKQTSKPGKSLPIKENN